VLGAGAIEKFAVSFWLEILAVATYALFIVFCHLPPLLRIVSGLFPLPQVITIFVDIISSIHCSDQRKWSSQKSKPEPIYYSQKARMLDKIITTEHNQIEK